MFNDDQYSSIPADVIASEGFAIVPSCILTAAAEVASADPARVALGRVHVAAAEGSIVAEATDSYTAVRVSAPCMSAEAAFDVLINAADVKRAKLPTRAGDYIALKVAGGALEYVTLKRPLRQCAAFSNVSAVSGTFAAFDHSYPIISRLFDKDGEELSHVTEFRADVIERTLKAARRIDARLPLQMTPYERRGVHTPFILYGADKPRGITLEAAVCPCNYY